MPDTTSEIASFDKLLGDLSKRKWNFAITSAYAPRGRIACKHIISQAQNIVRIFAKNEDFSPNGILSSIEEWMGKNVVVKVIIDGEQRPFGPDNIIFKKASQTFKKAVENDTAP